MQEQVLEGFRLSPQQRHLWLAPATADECLSQCAIVIDGEISPQRLQAALQTLTERHESLRTTFRCLTAMEVPIQVLADGSRVRFEVRQLAPSTDIRREVEEHLRLDARAESGAQKGFAGRYTLLRLGREKSVLLITLSSLYSDAASLTSMYAQLATLCAREESDAASDEEFVQYADYSEWQNELIEERSRSKAANYWESLTQTTARLPLQRWPDETGRGARETIATEIDSAVLQRLRGFCAEHGSNLQTAVLAALAVLAWRLHEQRSSTLGVLFAGRQMQGLANAVGLFAKYLPVEVSIEDDYTFVEVVRRTGDALAQAGAAQDYFSPGGLPIQFEWHSLPERIRAGGLQLSLLRLSSCIGPFELKLSCIESAEGVTLEFRHDSNVYSAAAVARLLERFVTLLADVAAAPERPVKLAELIPASERRQVLEQWNQTRQPYPTDVCLHEIFAHQAQSTPNAAAVIYDEQLLTFAQLDDTANQLARSLRQLRVGPDVAVGLCLERSCWMFVAVLGIWKAGGAYVPIDPGQPKERLAFVAKDAGCRAIVTQESLAGSLLEVGLPLIHIDVKNALQSEAERDDRQARVSPDNLAYIIYTSGSTGRPQGVMVRHRSAVNLAFALQKQIYGVAGRPLRVGLNAPLVFDASVKQLLQVVLGHSVCLIPEELRREPVGLCAYLAKHAVDALDCTPSQLTLWLAAGLPETLEGLPATLLVGGEALDERLWQLLGRASGKRCFNVYGPTECTVDATISEIRAGKPTIGAPIANVRAYVLDESLRPVPAGAVGQLHVGGEGLARGYVRRPDLTAQRFVPDPFAAEPGARMYRTGDVVRHFADGSLEYLGRSDHQVKLQGIRIELPEIEKVLREHPAVREAAVVVVKGEREVARLTGYVVPERRYLKKIDGQARYQLPNGKAIAHRNKNESEYLYLEIFEHQTYLRHGIRVPREAVVFDVGANIGMFSMFIAERFPDARIYAFEPIPPIFNVCRINSELYAPGVKLFPFGLSMRNETTAFTYYPHYSVMSGRAAYSNADADIQVIKRYLANRQASGAGESDELIEHADEFLAGRFMAEQYECNLRRLSDVIAGEKLERIDLLKIDVQRAELDVLQGIDDADWPKIRQVVMEVHDAAGQQTEGRLQEIASLLQRHGFETLIKQDEELLGTDRYNFYASRDGFQTASTEVPPAVSRDGPSADVLTAPALRLFLKEKLPDTMVPAALVLLDEMPLTRNGKIDRAALAAIDSRTSGAGQDYLAPQTGMERKIAAIWQQVLDLEQVGLQDNFFDLGGHSLLLVQLHRRLCEALEVEISMIEVFQHPTVAALAELLQQKSTQAKPTARFQSTQERAGKIRKAVNQRKQASKGWKGRL